MQLCTFTGWVRVQGASLHIYRKEIIGAQLITIRGGEPHYKKPRKKDSKNNFGILHYNKNFFLIQILACHFLKRSHPFLIIKSILNKQLN